MKSQRVVRAEVVVPASHRLIIPVAAGIAGCQEVVLQVAEVAVRSWIEIQDLLTDRTDTGGRNYVVRERVASVLYAGRTFVGSRAKARCQRIEYVHVPVCEVLAVADIQ